MSEIGGSPSRFSSKQSSEIAPGVTVRAAVPADVSMLLSMRRQLAISQNAEFAMRATEKDWLRDGFGLAARFTAFVGEYRGVAAGMLTYSQHYYTGWAGSALYVQDVYVDPQFRGRGIARALLARVAADAVALECPLVELTVHDESPATRVYGRAGFERVQHAAAYILAGTALIQLASEASPSDQS
ncbi:MAG TPA: GNAT family N-acetyltransferase [Xanthobacteraceae bacterium]|nr:GNAT family N-acetyltransferase [Xanthobacteraceae bacterium]